jgi:hypothetical protein
MSSDRARGILIAVFLAAMAVLLAPMAVAQDEKPTWSIEFVRPAIDEVVTGEITASVKVYPPSVDPTHLSIGFGDAGHVAMKPVPGTHYWRATVDTTRVLNGPAALHVYGMAPGVANRRTATLVDVRVDNPLECYFGNIHSHTYYSDGCMLPSDAYAYARDVAGMDFFCLTDHLEMVSEAEWRDIRETAWRMNEDGKFAAFPGLEWTKRTGHANLLDPPGRIWPPDMESLFETLPDADVVAMFNHPGDGTGDWGWKGLPYHEGADENMQLMEVRSDQELQAYILALNNGWHIAAAGTDDTHSPDWGTRGPWTGMWLPALTSDNVISALGRRHCYSTNDRNCRVLFRVNGEMMGTVIDDPVREVVLEIEIDDPDPGDKTSKIEIYQDGEMIDMPVFGQEKVRHTMTLRPEEGEHYFFVRVGQEDANVLTTAPVWVTVE